MVIQKVRTRGIPVAMIIGGGYTRDAAFVTSQSILNLMQLQLFTGPNLAYQKPPTTGMSRHYLVVFYSYFIHNTTIGEKTVQGGCKPGWQGRERHPGHFISFFLSSILPS